MATKKPKKKAARKASAPVARKAVKKPTTKTARRTVRKSVPQATTKTTKRPVKKTAKAAKAPARKPAKASVPTSTRAATAATATRKPASATRTRSATRSTTRSATPGSQLPDFATGILDSAAGVPWSLATALNSVDGYNGAVPGSCHVFSSLQNMPGGITSAIAYQSKLAIDNDGAGGNSAGDIHHQSATSLRHADNSSLDALAESFAVIPLDADEARASFPNDPSRQKKPGLPDFSDTLGLKIGDLGIAWWRRGKSGAVKSIAFIYADKGPANKLGEGSCFMAAALGINPDPNVGGLDAGEIAEMGKGVFHIAFPGSGARFKLDAKKTSLTKDQVTTEVAALMQAFKANA